MTKHKINISINKLLLNLDDEWILKKNNILLNNGYLCDEQLSINNLWVYNNDNIKICIILVSGLNKENHTLIFKSSNILYILEESPKIIQIILTGQIYLKIQMIEL